MTTAATFIGRTIILGFVLGIIDFILIFILLISNIGGETPSAAINFWNDVLGFIIDFPIKILFTPDFKDWPLGNLDIINLLAKAAIILMVPILANKVRRK